MEKNNDVTLISTIIAFLGLNFPFNFSLKGRTLSYSVRGTEFIPK
jgi:hypothetical protein